ncbi:MAG TPA: hypothetical protein VM735_09915, partial [Candidatus Kapabacteria bacterium]|nr:hypothetical protein [Candidatus Kapabacteria bacterium]
MKAWLSPSFPSALLKFTKNSAPFHFALAIVLSAFTPALALAQNITNPVPALEFSQYFRVGSGSVVTQRYTLSGPIGGERLYPGTRVARAGDSGYYFGTERQDVYMLNPRLGTFSGIPLGEISPEMAAQGWPTGLGYDATLGEVILVSLGGEGYIHTYSASTGWRLLASME